MTDTINALDILARLKSAVNAAGPDTKRECRYVVAGKPHCIAGTVLAELGVPVKTLQAYEETTVDAIKERNRNFEGVGSGPALPFVMTDTAWDVLAKAQYEQDGGLTWGRAFDAAVDEARALDVPNIPADY